MRQPLCGHDEAHCFLEEGEKVKRIRFHDSDERDRRPGLGDAYDVIDLCEMSASLREEFADWRLNCMTALAALGFGDMAARASREAYNRIDENSWMAFSIKQTFLDDGDTSSFCVFV